jgi:hypothetical protein
MRLRALPALVLALSASLVVTSGCKRLFGMGKDARTKTVSSPEPAGSGGARRALDVPVSWTEDIERNPAAELAVGSREEDVFVMVICEPKKDFQGYTLERYAELGRASVMKNLAGAKSGAKVDVQIGERRGVEAELSGTFRDAKLAYLHTSVEVPASYCQVTGWTSEARWAEKSPLLRKVTATFRELD